MDRRFILGIVVLVALLGASALALTNRESTVPPKTSSGPQRPASSVPASAPAGASPSRYILAVEWFPSFCELQPDVPECVGPTAQLALHGMWPEGEYCGVSKDVENTDRAGRWSRLPPVELSADTWAALRRAMPGTQSFLERHEWVIHGSCSGVSQEVYFSRAIALFDKVVDSGVEDLLVERAGRRLTRAEIVKAFDQAFGDGAGEKIRMSCKATSRGDIVDEFTIPLYGDAMRGESFESLLRATRQRGGGCEGGIL